MILSIPFFIFIFWLFWWICLTSNVGKIFPFGNMHLHELWPNVIVWFSQNNSWIKSTFRLKNNSIFFTHFFFSITKKGRWLAYRQNIQDFSIMALIPSSNWWMVVFYSLFHSFMYRVYIERVITILRIGKNDTRNEWYKEKTTNILISQHS